MNSVFNSQIRCHLKPSLTCKNGNGRSESNSSVPKEVKKFTSQTALPYGRIQNGRHRVQIITCMDEMKKQYAISRQLLTVYSEYLTNIRSAVGPLKNLKLILSQMYEKEWCQAKILTDLLEDIVLKWSSYAQELNQLKNSIERYFDIFEEVQHVLDEWIHIRQKNKKNLKCNPHSCQRCMRTPRSISEVEDDLMQRFKIAFASRIHLILYKYFGGYMKALKNFGQELSKAAEKGQEILEVLPSTNPEIPLGNGVPSMSLWDVWYEAKMLNTKEQECFNSGGDYPKQTTF